MPPHGQPSRRRFLHQIRLARNRAIHPRNLTTQDSRDRASRIRKAILRRGKRKVPRLASIKKRPKRAQELAANARQRDAIYPQAERQFIPASLNIKRYGFEAAHSVTCAPT
jgi:hypothetical protein